MYALQRTVEDASQAGACMEPYQWWLTFGATKPCLQKAAINILSQSPTSSACERNWSTYDWVMSKKRNRLAPANAEKLVYIFHNTRAIRKIENVDLNYKYAADVEAMLLERSIGFGSEAESSS